MSRDYTKITDEQLRAINKRAIEQPSYDELREQNRVLWEALQAAKYELAALFPIPSAPTVHAALEVCGNNNEADARCIYLAYEAICAALTATSQEGQSKFGTGQHDSPGHNIPGATSL